MCAIMPERLAATEPFKRVTEMVGSGPYRFKADERVQGSRFVYERFQDYKPREDGGAPEWTSGPKVAHFDRVEWHVIPDPATAAAALQRGEMDGWELPISDLLPMLERDRKLKLETVYDTGFCMLMRPNHLIPPFDNPAVRRALLGVVDQTEAMIAAMGEDPALRKVPCGFFPPGSPMASDAGMAVLDGKRDYDRAERDLQAAGYEGEKIALMVPTDYPLAKAACDVSADMMKRAGMNVDYQAVDWGHGGAAARQQKPSRPGRLERALHLLLRRRLLHPGHPPAAERQRRPGLVRVASQPQNRGVAGPMVRRARPDRAEADRGRTPGTGF